MEELNAEEKSNRQRKLIVVDDSVSGKAAGGVQLLIRTLAGQDLPGLEVTCATSDRVLALIAGTSKNVFITIYVQKSGSLSSEYLKLANSWLTAGARVVEKNVFAHASRFRPQHPNYHMSLMSQDGAFRFVLRSLFVSSGKRRSYWHLPLPTFERTSEDEPAESRSTDELTLLRIGRPDPIKWSEFEREFAENLVRSTGRKIRLIRVGYPGADGSNRTRSQGPLTIEDLPYSEDISTLYNSADIYLHHSRIGETFGNTLAEAKQAGLPVIMAVDLHWDCAGIELLSHAWDVIGEPKHLTRNAATVVRSVMGINESAAGPLKEQMSPKHFVELITADVVGCERTLPSLWRSVCHLWRLTSLVDGAGPLSFVRALIVEPVRSLRHAGRLES